MNQKILAILGPTNTGKTHMAIERMMEHANGVIGFPLRLLRVKYTIKFHQKSVRRELH